MMKNLLLSLTIVVATILNLQAQGKIVFDKMSHDFGEMKEVGGPVTVRFNFTNKGGGALSLTEVRPSCGCTTPAWSKAPVYSGKTGYVEATYNPKGRPGKFNKSITVKTTGEPQIVVLKISGNVIPRDKGPHDFYPMQIGSLRFKTTHLVYGEVMHNGSEEASTVVYNDGDKPVSINLEGSEIPSHLKVSTSKSTLAPKDTLLLSVTYDASRRGEWGYNFEHFVLKTNDLVKPGKRINLSATIKENFDNLPADAKRPSLRVDKKTHDFGNIQQNMQVSTHFTITNDGEAPLLIRKVKASCGCTVPKLQKTELAPGESTDIQVSFSSANRNGKQRKSITLVCNDPQQDITTLWIYSNVVNTEVKE
ncbi:DUF1573 domain-containing protein [Rapidithrix thailandica]|uniref:DUF1573 domain-containing protein n=1 Tax=Rapidithrix thailandica TaxID=413964 RepID=A0AAW9SB02_9BACT